MNFTEAKEKLSSYRSTMGALGHASGLLYYDGATIAPKKSAAVRASTMGELSRMSYELQCDPRTLEMMEVLRENAEALSSVDRRAVSEMWREYEMTSRIPKEEFVAYTVLLAQADELWHEAKEKSDFALFAPCLAKVFDATKRIASYTDPEKDPYDATLDRFERGMTKEFCDRFFGTLREKIVPLMGEIAGAKQIDDAPLHGHFPVERQRAFSSYLMDLMAMDRDACIIGETEHPFTTNFTKKDVRITTHYYEQDFASSMYSVIHEGGHALYEMGTGEELMYTGLGSGVSMAIHESQSRFYENIIGRSRPFCSLILPYLQKEFPEQLGGVDAESFYRMINRSTPSLIRVEADELTYSLHIMVRYELEKALFDGSIAVSDLPGEWNRLYREYLGIDVPDDRRGVLQDSHWANGNIGYFPSYALGSAYGAQFLSRMEKEFDVYGAVAAGDFARINRWNEEHIWRHGCMMDPGPLFESVCGPFDPGFYTDYLSKKYREIYGI